MFSILDGSRGDLGCRLPSERASRAAGSALKCIAKNCEQNVLFHLGRITRGTDTIHSDRN